MSEVGFSFVNCPRCGIGVGFMYSLSEDGSVMKEAEQALKNHRPFCKGRNREGPQSNSTQEHPPRRLAPR